ncbi:Kazal-type serine protease inhibitor domain-containing protein [Nannocystis exedens]|uniref:Kazal-type serine protease inhibitor domain-containing protein n=1 Tax=Nannocystis exedens TaxID=54 RepID=A0A1I1T9P8_9BACT|nr:hypothetical protein [Nannocystis exedens]PCC66814.1 hypothetical protein NAEX_09409 [Nannocystis exedens]SFD53033.1 Kazal-type serine protease inhibitor domain-containing protein [Nannocystis exedens]
MIQQALLRTLALVFATTVVFAGGCKDTSGAGSGVPGTADPAGTAGAGGGGAQTPVEAKPETTPETTPVAATAGETASPSTPPRPDDSTTVFVECTTRSSMCTREYNPVCGKLTDGSRKSFSNKCVACGDHAVVGYSPGACPEPPPT